MPHNLLDWLRFADTAALALFAARLSYERLYGVYLALYAHAIFEVVRQIGMFNIPFRTFAYGLIFILTTPILWGLWILIVRNLNHSALGPYPGLASAGRRVLKIALCVGAVIIALTIAFDFLHWGPGNRILPVVYLFDRTITALLALVILALCGFLAWFVVPTRRNVAYLCMGFGIIFATRTASEFASNVLGPTAIAVANYVMIASSISVFLAWALLLNRAGEEKTAFVGRRPSPGEIELAMKKLSAVSRELSGGNH